MVRSLAVLSDVHGVLPLLDAVLAEPEVAGADLVVVCGDHAAGPQPTAVIDRLSGLGERAVLVRGNADRELAALSRGADLDVGDPVSDWAAGVLRPGDAAWLDGLAHPSVTLAVDGFGPVLCCHATPRDDTEVVLVDSRLDRWSEVFDGLAPEVRTVVCGHTHMPFVRLVAGRLVVNPGSVGMGYGPPGASWALLRDGAVTLHRTVPDLRAAADAVVAGSDYPDRVAWVEKYLLAPPSDVDALTAFGPRDGRGAQG